MTDFSPLVKDEERCRLASQSLVDEVNAVGEVFREFERSLPALFNSDGVQRHLKEFLEHRERVSRQFYRVGFIGESQAGKSTTFNNVLGVVKGLLDDSEYERLAPATLGRGLAMTSAATRLRAGTEARMQVRYLTPQEHEARRAVMFDVCGISPEAKISQAIEQLDEQIRAASVSPNDADQQTEAPEGEATPADFQKLRDYLAAWQSHGAEKVREGRIEEPYDYAKRREFVNHQEREGPRYQLLLKDVLLEFPTEEISHDLELIDLPGLGASCWDNALTKDYFQTLDACLLFVNVVGNIDNIAFNSNIKRLKERFGRDLRDRVWVIYTRCDGLGDAHIHGTLQDKKGIGNSIAEALENKVPLSQVFLVSNSLFERHAQRNPEDGTVTAMVPPVEFTAMPWRLGIENGQIVPPALWRELPDLVPALQRFTKDGGIGSLRKLLGTDIATVVRDRVDREARQAMKRLRESLKSILELAKSRATNGNDRDIMALRWSKTVQRLVADLDERSELYQEPSMRLVGEMRKLFDDVCPADHPAQAEAIAKLHRLTWNALRARLENDVDEFLRDVFHLAASALDAAKPDGVTRIQVLVPNGQQDELRPLPDAFGVALRNKQLNEKLRQMTLGEWESRDLFSAHNGYMTFDSIGDYRTHMNDRIAVFVFRVTHRLVRAVQRQLLVIDTQLGILNEADKVNAPLGNEAEFDAILQRLS